MQNPIDAHLLIRHLATGWPALKKSLEKFHDLMEIAGNRLSYSFYKNFDI